MTQATLRISSNDLELVYDTYGSPANAPVIFAHGGGQTRHAWKGAAQSVALQGFYAVSLDLRGHGDSEWASDCDYSLEAFANDLIALAGEVSVPSGQKPHIVGASLGGLSALVAAGFLAPDTFASVTLVDVTPNMDEEGVEKILGFMAEHIEEGFSSLEEVAEVIGKYLPHRPKPKDLDGLRKNLRQKENGRWYWHWDPAFIHGGRKLSKSSRVPTLEEATSNITIPMHLIRGRMSELVPEEAVDEFMTLAPHAHYTDVADARHMVAGDKNDVFTGAVVTFLKEI